MALAFLHNLQDLWPFSLFKYDDLRASDELVRRLPIPEHTKKFVFAIREPESQSVIYILSAQNLSERSALDAECLIREVRPDVVVAQVGVVSEILSEESELGDNDNVNDPLPTSSFGVLKRCFVDKINKERYEIVAGNLVLREIFGIGFHGHFLAAKRAAKEVGSSFMVLESQLVSSSNVDSPSTDVDVGNKVQGFVSSLVPQKMGSAVSSSSRRFLLINNIQSQLLSSNVDLGLGLKLRPLSSNSDTESKEVQPRSSYQVPPFAQSIYPLLVDLHDIFVDVPSLARALALAQKMFFDVNRGEVMDAQVISEVYTFRIAVEWLRIALNNAGRQPINKLRNSNSANIDFSELPVEDKCHALLSQTLRSQAKKFRTMVAVVDAGCLAGLRKHWNTPVPHEVMDLVGQLVSNCDDDGETSDHMNKNGLFSNKPVVAVGAGATAVLGASSLSKAVPASTFMKVVAFKTPASLKLILTQTQKVMAIALSKTKVVAPGLATSGSNTTSVLKATASAEKIRAVAHSVIASVEKTSFSAMRTAFYEIMRKRRVQPVGALPWATFGCSIATCVGLLAYGDGIECVAESFPTAPSIASLGRGVQSLRQTSQAARQTDGIGIYNSIETLMCGLKKVTVQ